MTGREESVVLEIDPETIEKAGRLLAQAMIDLHMNMELQKPYLYEDEALVIRLDQISSSILGISDPLGQLGAWLKDVISGTIGWLWGQIKGALADLAAEIVTKIGGKFPELAEKIAAGIKMMGDAISSSIVAVGASIQVALAGISTGLTALSVGLNNLGTAISGAITMMGTSLATQIASLAYSMSQSIVSLGTSVAQSIGALATSISQSILSLSTSISVGLMNVSTSIAGAVTAIVTAVSSGLAMLSTSIAFAINQVGTSIAAQITSIAGAITSAIASIGAGISQAILSISASISQSILTLSTSLSAAILQISTSITAALGTFAATVTASLYLLMGRVDAAVSIMQTYMPALRDALRDSLITMSQAIKDSFKTVSSAISDAFDKFSEKIRQSFTDFINTLSDNMKKMTDTIIENSARINATLASNLRVMADAISYTSMRITESIRYTHESLTQAIIQSYKETSKAIAESFDKLTETLSRNLERISNTLRDQYEKARDAILETGEKTMKFILDSSKQVTSTVIENLKNVMSAISEVMDELSKNLLGLAQAWQGFINGILQLPDRFEPTLKKHAGYVWSQLFAETTEDFRKVFTELPRFFTAGSPSPFDALINALMKVWDFIRDPLKGMQEVAGAIWGGIQWLGQKIWEGMTFIGGLIWRGIETLWNMVRSGFEWFLKALTDFGCRLIEGLVVLAKEALRVITGGGVEIFQDLYNFTINSALKWAGAFGTPLVVASQQTIMPMLTAVDEKLEEEFARTIEQMARGEVKQGQMMEIVKLMGLYTLSIVGGQYISVGAWAVLHGLATPLSRIEIKTPIKIRLKGKGKAAPIGVGAEAGADAEGGVEVPITINLGMVLRALAREVRRYGNTFGRSLIYGMGIWLSQPYLRLANAAFRNLLVVEMPTIDTMAEIVRRHMPHKEFNRVLEDYRKYLRLYGYNDRIVEWLTSTAEENKMIIEVTDRFGQTRKVPLSLLYNMPSASDVARMAIRDIFGMGREAVESFMQIYSARGMHPDVGVLYYLLHYRYPPPERLWAFTCRGISGLLWATIPGDVMGKISAEAGRLGAGVPTPASAWNFRVRELVTALQTYMTWHDYARFSWIKGRMFGWDRDFTSDNQIMIDTLADIPTKIDQRWMVRFGLYQLMAERGIRHTSEAKRFITDMVEGTARSSIILDLTNFCRTLQATGLHPYYVPITAVAEVINTVADERTLLRTGVVNLYKEGFYGVSSIMKMLTGLLTTSFKVAYVDVDAGQWREGYINVPLRYLDMEARLIGIRALADRALDILRDIQRDVLTGYQEFIIGTYDEFRERFSKVIEWVGEMVSRDFEAITGQPMPDELKLAFREEYYKPYVAALSIWRDIYTVRRIRLWTQRWLGWLMYRVAYGVAKIEELDQLVEYMAKACRMPDPEKEYIRGVMAFMWQIAVREYIPTPSQLATLSEYVKLPEDLVNAALEARQVPAEWQSIWRAYMKVRPLVDDVRGLITAYRRLLVYADVPQQIHSAVRGYMAMIGYSDKEMEIFDLRVKIEEMIAGLKEYVPTPMQMATLAEHVKLPKELTSRAFDVRHVPEAWRSVWESYIDVRPLADDVRDLIRAYLRALEYTAEAKQMEGLVTSYAQRIGFGPEEVSMLQARARLEEMIYNAREWVPTPMQLAAICEVLPEARRFYESMLRVRRIPPEWHELWARYIDIRPLVDDVKKMLSRAESLYVRFMIPEERFMEILRSVADYMGLTEREAEFLLYTSRLERHATAWRELIGDVDRMVMLSEYSPTARQFALGTIYKMIDALSIDQETKTLLKKMWEDFVRIRPVIEEVRKYVTDLINAFVDGTVSQQAFEEELEALREWGLDDYEIQFYKAIATLRKARKLRIALY